MALASRECRKRNGAKSPRLAAQIFRRSEIAMLKSFLQGKPLRHPLHPMLVHFPIGLLLLSLILDLTSLVSPSAQNLPRSSFYAMFAGVITALLAAIPGLADYSGIRSDHPAKRTATAHMILNLIVV